MPRECSCLSRLALCGPMDCSPWGSSVPGISRKNTGAGCLPCSWGSFNPVTEPATPLSPALQVDSLSTELYTVPSTNRCVCVCVCVWKRWWIPELYTNKANIIYPESDAWLDFCEYSGIKWARLACGVCSACFVGSSSLAGSFGHAPNCYT